MNNRRRRAKTNWLVTQALEPRQMLTTITVTNLNDSGPGSLRDALQVANIEEGPETIVFDDGVAGTINLQGSELDIGGSVTIQGAGMITVDAGGQSRVFDVGNDGDGQIDNVVLDGLNIQNGSSDGVGGNIRSAENLTIRNSNIAGGNAETGGGIGIAGNPQSLGSLQVIDSVVDGNTADNGGGIAVTTDGGGKYTETVDVSVSNTTISNNAAGEDGGGIFGDTEAVGFDIQNSTLDQNSAEENGGGIAVSDGANVSATNSDITNNQADTGGGISSQNTNVLLNNSRVNDNEASTTGAGVNIEGDGMKNNGNQPELVLLNGTEVNGNTAVVDGGGVNAVNGARVEVLDQSMLVGNSANTGGGLFANNAEVTTENSTISGNSATGPGGFSEGRGGAVALFNSTFIGFNIALQNNQAANDGGAIAATYGSNVNITSQSSESNSFVLGSQEGLAGSQFSDNSSTNDGGAIFVDATSTLSVEDADFVNNSAENNGGAILIEPADSNFDFLARGDSPQLTILESVLSGNSSDEEGGGIHIGANQTAMIQSTTISNNTADNGGGIYLRGTLNCNDCTISSNIATSFSGGGIELGNFSTSGTFTTSVITDSVIENNTAPFRGGGINLDNNSSLVLDNSTVRGNSANQRGGGIHGSSLSTHSITNSTITGNTSASGGGLAFNGSEGNVSNTTIADNEAADGGGIYIRNLLDVNTFDNVTVAGNTATDQGGGLLVRSFGTATDISFRNSILADNTAVNGGNDLFNTVDTFDIQFDFSLIEDPVGAPISGSNNLLNVDPLLAALANNGGPTQTQLLMAGSPAIDAGDPNAVAGQNGVPEFDQRGTGFDRVVGGGIDIGATEVQVDVPNAPGIESIVIQNGSAQRSVIREITVTFDSIVNVADGAFELTNEADQAVDVAVALSQVGNQTIATLTFSGALTDSTGSLVDGQYSLRIIDDLITDDAGNTADSDGDGISGNDRIDDFFRLYGDADGDGSVGFFDYALFRNALFSMEGDDELDIAFDANGDGVIDLLDIQDFRDNFGASI